MSSDSIPPPGRTALPSHLPVRGLGVGARTTGAVGVADWTGAAQAVTTSSSKSFRARRRMYGSIVQDVLILTVL